MFFEKIKKGLFVNFYNFNKIIRRIGEKLIKFCFFFLQEENYEFFNVFIEKMMLYNQEFMVK